MNVSVLAVPDTGRRDSDIQLRARTVDPIRVLVLTDTNVGGRGGAEQHLKVLASKLNPENFSLHIVQLGIRGVPQSEGRVGCATFSSLPTHRVLSSLGLRRIAQVFSLAREGRYHAIISFFENSDIIAALVGRMAGIKVLISSRRDTGFRHSWRVRLAYRLINGRFNSIVAASNAVLSALVSDGADARVIKTIHNGIDADRFQNVDGTRIRTEHGIGSGEDVLAMVANLNPVKNHALVIECLRRLHQVGQPCHLLLAGDGPLQSELRRLAERLEVERFVHFLGRRADIENVLAAADIFVLASHTEGLSNALLEAMAAGKAVVATDVGGNSEVVKDGVNGCLVVPDDASALTNAIKRLLQSRPLRDSFGQSARMHVRENFSIENMITAYSDLIKKEVDASHWSI
jgi:glycosyltransferase involved in cell wall biosynthesis